jgi:hypothetical protein
MSKRFGGNIVPGREIRKRKDRDSKGHADQKGQDSVEVAMDPSAQLLRHHGTSNHFLFSIEGVRYGLKVTILPSVPDHIGRR